MGKSVIIAGAGIAGLSAGYYAQINGYRVSIFEMNSAAGGLCTAYKRMGYTWDLSMHNLNNSKRGPLYRMWKELGVLNENKFHYHSEMMRVESGEKRLSFGVDKNKLQEAMLAISPQDSEAIKKYIDLIFGRSMMSAASLKPGILQNPIDKLKIFLAVVPLLPMLVKYGNLTMREYAGFFKDPFLQNAARFVIDSPGWPMLRCPVAGAAGFIRSSVVEAGVPIGGSQKVVHGIAERFCKSGGEIFYKSPVSELIIENDRVCGVKLQNGTGHRADIVIWAADGHHLIFDMLKEKYINEQIRKMYTTWTPVLPMVQVMIGVNRDMSSEPHRILIELDNPLQIADEDHKWISVKHHCFDPTAAPPGKSAVEVWYATNYEYWENLLKDRKKYEEEKNRIARITIAELDKRWPGFANQVEVVDVPTPMTYNRYTGNWRGSPDGWYVTPDNMRITEMIRSLPGLEGLYTIGQWTAPFMGTIMSALSGRQIVELICKGDRKKFVTVKK